MGEKKQIPKVIHYCWFGKNPLPELALDCIDSWKKYCPDYEIKEWNEDNFDFDCCDYVKEAYEAGKWAFVSDYARFYILHQCGGVYFDTDVELVKPIDDIVNRGPFMGIERGEDSVNVGLGFGAYAGFPFLKEVLDYYETQHFLKEDGSYDLTTVVSRVTELLKQYGYKNKNTKQYINKIYIYPTEYFCPMDFLTGKLRMTAHTRTVHHYAASWLNEDGFGYHKRMKILANIVGSKNALRIDKAAYKAYTAVKGLVKKDKSNRK